MREKDYFDWMFGVGTGGYPLCQCAKGLDKRHEVKAIKVPRVNSGIEENTRFNGWQRKQPAKTAAWQWSDKNRNNEMVHMASPSIIFGGKEKLNGKL